MKEQGFGTMEVMAFLFVIALSFTIVAVLSNQLTKKIENKENASINNSVHDVPIPTLDTASYHTLEKSIASKSENYFSNNTTNSKIDYVTIQTLIQDGYIGSVHAVTDETQECSGYVEFLKTQNIYKTYLKCGEVYQTDGYDALKEIG